MIHLRIVAPHEPSARALEALKANPSVCNIVYLEGAAYEPKGDVILCDVAREDGSVVMSDLRELDLDKVGSISIEDIDAQVSERAKRAEKHARGSPSDAVVWEEVEARTSESAQLSASFVAFMVIAG